MNKSQYHNTDYPCDINGTQIKPLDLVIMGVIPDHNWAEEGSETLKEYEGCFGLVTYHNYGDGNYNPYFNGNTTHPGWVDREYKTVFVQSKKLSSDKDAVVSWDFWLPSSSVLRIPYNSLIMNIFVEYPWQMNEVDGPSDYLFIRSGIPEYEYIKKIMETPYEDLVTAHDAAMAVLENK